MCSEQQLQVRDKKRKVESGKWKVEITSVESEVCNFRTELVASTARSAEKPWLLWQISYWRINCCEE